MNQKQTSLIKSLARSSYFSNKVAACSSNRINPNLLFQPRNINSSFNEQLIRQTSTTATKRNTVFLDPFISNSPIENIGKNLDLTFNDSKTAFAAKSNLELLRGYLVFQLCGLKFLIQHQQILLDVARKLLGKKLFDVLMKNTFYGHFVAGENQNEIRKNVENMKKYGVKSILDYSAEEDLESGKSKKVHCETTLNTGRVLYEPNEHQCEKNLQVFMDCIDTVTDVTQSTGLAAIKITSLIRPALLLKYSTLIDSIEKHDKENPDNKVDADIFKMSSLLNKSDEEFAKSFNMLGSEFTPNELGELKNMFLRLDELAKHALEKKCRMFVDAEQTYFQSAIRRVTIELMREFNKDQCTVMNTYQNYLKSAYTSLVQDIEQADKEGFRFGAKLVRGAYMEQERERALKMGYEDPVNESYEATTKMYESSFVHCLNEIKKKPGFVNIMVASHNEETVRFAVEKMDQYGINPNDKTVCFGQLFGMCDFISFYLGGNGFSVFKYVPYGPVEEVMPYLSRRATENGKGLFEKMEKEKRLITSELKRRLCF